MPKKSHQTDRKANYIKKGNGTQLVKGNTAPKINEKSRLGISSSNIISTNGDLTNERIIETSDGTIIVETSKTVYVNKTENIAEQKYISNLTGGTIQVGTINDTTYTNVANGVYKLGFDTNSGFDVTDLGDGLAKIGMNSTFKFWQINGLQGLVACGIDTVNFIPGDNISITADNNTSPKSFTISSAGGGAELDQYCSLIVKGSPSTSSGLSNVAIGYCALGTNTTGSNNVAVGIQALGGNTTGAYNIAIGNNTMQNFGYASGVYGGVYGNIAMGFCTALGLGCNNIDHNIMIGSYVMGNDYSPRDGLSDNIAIGKYSMFFTAYGASANIAIGADTLSTVCNSGWNVSIGAKGGQQACNSCQNIVIGEYAGNYLNYSRCNIAIGEGAGYSISTGLGNIAIGTSTLDAICGGCSNIAIGEYAVAYSSGVGNENIVLGYLSGGAIGMTLGSSNNIAFGSFSQYNNCCGGNNISLGTCSLYYSRVGNCNIGIGMNSLGCLQLGCNNVAIGAGAGQCVCCSDKGNTFIGFQAGNYHQFGYGVAVGAYALSRAGCAPYAVAIGINTLGDSTGCNGFHCHGYSTAVGSGAGGALAMGACSVLIGYQAGYGYSNSKCLVDVIAIGNRVMFCAGGGKLTGSIAIGAYSAWCLEGWPALGPSEDTPTIAIGSYSLKCTTTGQENIAIGRYTLCSNTIGSKNIAIGNCSMSNTDCGNSNVAIGAYALRGGGSAMQCNTVIGTYAGCTTYGCNNIIIGYCALGQTSFSNNTITLGNSGINCIRAQVTTISALSDARDKIDIQELPLGLQFIMNLRPVKFTWNMRDGAKTGVEDTGFIAQEVAELEDRYGSSQYLDMVGRENPERLELKPAKLIPILVKAIQELANKVDKNDKELWTELENIKKLVGT